MRSGKLLLRNIWYIGAGDCRACLLADIHPTFGQAGEDLKTVWQIMPLESGTYYGEVWLYLHPISENQGDGIRQPISILSIHLQSIDLFGMTGRQARISGMLGIGILLLLWWGMNGNIIKRLFRQEGKGQNW